MKSDNENNINALFLTKNLSDYKSADYQNDMLNSLSNFFKIVKYGPGYNNFDVKYNLEDIEKIYQKKFDVIIAGHSFLSDNKNFTKINIFNFEFKKIKIPKIIFLNKEYVNLKKKLSFIDQNNFDLVFSHHHIAIKLKKMVNNKFEFIPFASNFSNVSLCNDKKYDLNFIGILQNLNKDYKHTNERVLIRNLFYNNFSILNLKKRDKFKHLNVFWQSHPRNYIENILAKIFQIKRLKKEDYKNIIWRSKMTFNTPSPYNIIGPRFYDALILGSPIICPKKKFYKYYFDKEDLIQYESISEFTEKINLYLKRKEELLLLSEKNMQKYSKHTYYERAKFIFEKIKNI